MKYVATSPEDYVNQLPEERRGVVKKLREVILKNLPKGFEETMNYGVIGYVVPHSLYPNGYHCNTELPLPFINIASQKNAVVLYHSGIYALPELKQWFVDEYPKHCKYKLDMGKSCIRFKKLDDVPYALIGVLAKKITPNQWVSNYESAIKK